nr:helix-turn-helix domain-containing protein [Chitinophaga nivalis]
MGLNAFRPALEGDSRLLYHEIQGSRLIEKPHKHDFFVFLLMEQGSGIHAIDFVDYAVTGQQIHLLFPDQVHRWELGADTMAYQLMISRRIFETFSSSLHFSFLLYQNHPVIHLAPGIFQQLLYEFKAIQQELGRGTIDWDIIHLRSQLIAQLVCREAENKFDDMLIYQAKPVLFKYHALVDAAFKEQKSVSFYADQLHITPNYLNILCKRHLHMTATSLIQNRVTLEAKRLLRASDKSVKEIAFELGFHDLAYFSNFLKSQTGISPREFRGEL